MKTFEPLKTVRELYTAGPEIEEITAERGTFLCVDGRDDPSGGAFQRARDLLFTAALAVRSQLKKSGKVDFRLARLEFRWLTDPQGTDRSKRNWRLMLRVPDEVDQARLKEARKTLLQKGVDASAVKRVSWREGRALQVLHVGQRRATEAVCDRLRSRAGELGYRVRGPRHEIYINDPSRAAADKLKTIVRLPIAWPRPEYAKGRSHSR